MISLRFIQVFISASDETLKKGKKKGMLKGWRPLLCPVNGKAVVYFM